VSSEFKYRLGVNLGFAVNRYPEPEEWIDAVLEIGVRKVQFVADLLNPNLPESLRQKKIKRIKQLCEANDIEIESAFTGAFTRVNHFGSEDSELRKYWLNWFVEYAIQMSQLGVTSIGGHPGILSLKNDMNKFERSRRVEEIAYCWNQVLVKTKQYGIEFVIWEPMSISREIGHTIEDALRFQTILEAFDSNKFKICLDLDHGDIESGNTNDINPLAWIEYAGAHIGMLHLKQTTIDRRKHMSFTPENNEKGTVNAREIIKALSDKKVPSCTLFLELGFRERNPDDRLSIIENKMSVKHWIDAGVEL
jgi:D-erythrulose 1-phosphate 3-epimerase